MSKTTPNGPVVSAKVKSPSHDPAEELTTLGGLPPEKTETGKGGINDSNDPLKRKPAPDTVHGV
jgi:hypothetical protein